LDISIGADVKAGIYISKEIEIKSKGKQIEKDIINDVLKFEKYKGLKRISFDEFRNDVETQIMKLEKIRTNSYASYGEDNLGGNVIMS
jgi:hypothetical protein